MRKVCDVIEIIKDSNYFDAWKEVFLSETAVSEWQYLLDNRDSKHVYDALGDKLHSNNVPYVIVTEYISEFFRYYDKYDDYHDIKNNVAEAYLKKKLKSDCELISQEINKKLSIPLLEKKDLINAHLHWMQNFISTIVGTPKFFQLDPRRCFVGLWILEENIEDLHPTVAQLHTNLHAMAQSALRMYSRNDYAYFLLLYLDILMSSYQIRDIIMNIYFTKRLNSIYEDPLTRAGNYFQLRMDMQSQTEPTTLLILNIKEFSKINLLYGHDVGDIIIKEVFEYIPEIVQVTDMYRIYGDELAIIFPLEDKEKNIKYIKHKLEEKEFRIDEDVITLSFYGSLSSTSSDALERCEYGLMLSKNNLGEISDVDIIDDSVLQRYADNITLSQELRLAFMDNRIVPYFQPIMDLDTGKIIKYEALMRVIDIHSNILEPASFLEVLQEMYLYPEVTKLMIKKTFEVFENSDLQFSINLSFADIINLDTEAFIIAILKQYPDAASRCTFELLENEAIHNHVEVIDFFELLHAYGVTLALDDFGVGYSNYETIFKFDIDFIKIDGSLTQSILTNERSRVLMESIVTVAKKLDAKLIVECVSSKELLDEISKMDVDYVQGYYIGKPQEGLLL
ncbi:MAG: diguanylate cyclase (GGDEF)-like protein [Sulfurimonas sp.]|jgi:diguanylate cyclase (GGDEF)-like protein|uniref:EAL domain-containing protein n=1 Tax=Sulfurimonas sp. TaxID=2022749 RepID=UPI0039E41C45